MRGAKGLFVRARKSGSDEISWGRRTPELQALQYDRCHAVSLVLLPGMHCLASFGPKLLCAETSNLVTMRYSGEVAEV